MGKLSYFPIVFEFSYISEKIVSYGAKNKRESIGPLSPTFVISCNIWAFISCNIWAIRFYLHLSPQFTSTVLFLLLQRAWNQAEEPGLLKGLALIPSTACPQDEICEDKPTIPCISHQFKHISPLEIIVRLALYLNLYEASPCLYSTLYEASP